MASEKTIARIERMTWNLIFVGLFAIVLGLASMASSPGAAWALIVVGGVLTVAGVVLIWVRSRMSPPG